MLANCLDTDASLAPMSPLCVVSDGVTSSKTDPLRNWSVLLLGLCKLLLGSETLVTRHLDYCRRRCRVMSLS